MMNSRCHTTEQAYAKANQRVSFTGNGKSEDFLWDGLALIHRGENSFINEPYVTGGNPILSSKDGVMFNDMLGSTLNIGGKAINMTAFGESADSNAMYTGKPYIGELGYAFLFRNYRSDYGKWQTTDPLGYPDGWNNLAYCNNGVTDVIDFIGAVIKQGTNTGTAAYRNFINNVINVASQSNTMLGQAIRNSNATVNFVQNNNKWPNVDKGFLGLQTPTITMDIYDYKMDNVVRNPIFTLLHELAHVVANGTEASINQKVEQLLADGAIQSQLKQIMSTYPAKGEITGTLRADQTYTVGYRREYGE